MREIGAEELYAASTHLFVRHQMDPRATTRAWVGVEAIVVEGTVSRWTDDPPGPLLTCLGPPGELGPLMAEVDAAHGPPWRVTVEAAAQDLLPPTWRQHEPTAWDWMLTRTAVPAGLSATQPVEDVTDADEITAFLEVANPGAFAGPHTPGVEGWVGCRVAGDLVAIGAVLRQPDGTGHLRSIAVLPAYAGAGRGRAVSAELTRRALAGRSGLATLGVYSDNVPALAVYRRLGFTRALEFRSGEVAAPVPPELR